MERREKEDRNGAARRRERDSVYPGEREKGNGKEETKGVPGVGFN